VLLTEQLTFFIIYLAVENGYENGFLISYISIYGTFASVVGLTLNTPGDLAISLGTSDTVSWEDVLKIVLVTWHVYLMLVHNSFPIL
jgi:hypothetical protein